MAELNFFQGQTNLLSQMIEENTSKEDRVKEIQKKMIEFLNVKNIHFLFGSGTSCNAIPNMKGLFEEVKKKIDTLDEKLKSEFTLIVERIEDKENLEEVLGIL